MRIPPEIKKLAMSREKYREEKNWQKADEIRQEVKKMGYWIEDTEKGPKIKPLSF
jgi:cysteinyl-tRNA synthetase